MSNVYGRRFKRDFPLVVQNCGEQEHIDLAVIGLQRHASREKLSLGIVPTAFVDAFRGNSMTDSVSQKYKPKPVDTSSVYLDPTQLKVIEPLARNIHEIWAQRRMAEGWIPGPARDDTKRTHPSLIPFERLDRTEQDYDRTIAVETVKLLIQLGFHISKG